MAEGGGRWRKVAAAALRFHSRWAPWWRMFSSSTEAGREILTWMPGELRKLRGCFVMINVAIRRYGAAAWLRKKVGVVGPKDLPAEPSEEEFRVGLRSGIILYNALNKVQPGAVSKVVESPCDATLISDGAALSAFQYFENVRNFLVAVQDLGMPTFEASDLEQFGKSSRIVICVMALKSFEEWKDAGSNGVWKFGGNVKQTTNTKQFVRKNSEPFTGSISRTTSVDERSSIAAFSEGSSNSKLQNSFFSMLIRMALMDKKPEDVPNLVESVLNKLVEEFEQRLSTQIKQHQVISLEPAISQGNKFASGKAKVENKSVATMRKVDCFQKSCSREEELKSSSMKQQLIIVGQQQTDIKGPQYVCTNFWTFVCITCSGIHREFTHRVKSVSMATFTSEEVEALQKGGNQRATEIYLKQWDSQSQRLPDNSNADKVREFIRNVYLNKKYLGGGSSDRPPRDLQNGRSRDEEIRRASSYHSYSQRLRVHQMIFSMKKGDMGNMYLC